MVTILDKYLHVSQADAYGNWYEGVIRYIPNRYGMTPKIIKRTARIALRWIIRTRRMISPFPSQHSLMADRR